MYLFYFIVIEGTGNITNPMAVVYTFYLLTHTEKTKKLVSNIIFLYFTICEAL